MTEQPPESGLDDVVPAHEQPAEQPDEAGSDEPMRTGVASVDAVLAEVDGLDEVPLEEHLPAFERAHESLRSALDADPGEPA